MQMSGMSAVRVCVTDGRAAQLLAKRRDVRLIGVAVEQAVRRRVPDARRLRQARRLLQVSRVSLNSCSPGIHARCCRNYVRFAGVSTTVQTARSALSTDDHAHPGW